MGQSPLTLRIAREDFPRFCRELLKVKNKRGELVPFNLNEQQLKLWRLIQWEMAAGRPVRVVIAKARQTGMTTFVAAFLFWRAVCFKGQSGLTIAHLEEATSEIFARTELYYEQLPASWRPTKDTARKGKKLAFKAPQYSLLYVGHAKDKSVGRGATFQAIHFSEVAFMDDARTVFTASMQTVPQEAGTFVFAESTSNGMGNQWHELCEGAALGEGHPDHNGWTLFFIAWFECAEYSTPWSEGDPPLTPSERILQREHGLTRDQLKWRRAKMREIGEDHFRQEYPSTLRESFLASGRPYFDAPVIDLHRKTVRPPLTKGAFAVRQGRARFVPETHGSVWVWERPSAQHAYVISADVASGGARDFSAIHVLKTHPLEQVASVRVHCDPDELAILIRRLGYSYLTFGDPKVPALVAPERNGGYGERCVEKLHDDLRYPNLYLDRKRATQGFVQSREYGFHTGRNRSAVLERLKEALREGDLQVRCERTLGELETFAYVAQPDGSERVQAPRGGFDDLTLALAIGVWVADEAPQVRPRRFEQGLEVLHSEAIGY